MPVRFYDVEGDGKPVSAKYSVLLPHRGGDAAAATKKKTHRGNSNDDTSRFDDSIATSIRRRAFRAFATLFLPEGYPSSVSSDYTAYQICDTLQALCSSVTGTLSTRAILRGVGVGEAEATVLGSTLQWIMRDGVSMVARLAFASIISSDLDNNAKRFRLVADITNDAGLVLEILSSHVAPYLFFPMVCVAAVFKAICGVAGGATRASLTQHFAVRQNTADVAAKDGSQETAVNLLGMFVGMAVAAFVPESFGPTVAVVVLIVAMHLAANYRGVRSLVLSHLNEARLLLCLSAWEAHFNNAPTHQRMPSLSSSSRADLTPRAINWRESVVFPPSRVLPVRIGVSLQPIGSSGGHPLMVLSTTAADDEHTDMGLVPLTDDAVAHELGRRRFCVVLTMTGRGGGGAAGRPTHQGTRPTGARIVLGPSAAARDVLIAYTIAVAAVRGSLNAALRPLADSPSTRPGRDAVGGEASSSSLYDGAARFVDGLVEHGWRVDRCQLRVGEVRVAIDR